MRSRRHGWKFGASILALLLCAGLGLRGDSDPSNRVERIGQQLICTCGCRENPLVCHTVGCTVKVQMQAEIRQRVQSRDSDALILQSFVQEYGSEVLANPTTQGFNLLAWVLPWVALGLGLTLVLLVVKRWSRRAAPAGGGGAGGAVSAEIQAEIAAATREWDD